EDARYLLDYYIGLNENPLIPFILCDEWYTTEQNWAGFNPWEQNAYVWQQRIFAPDERSLDYLVPYQKIFISNVVLDILEESGNSQEGESLRGEALFVRAMSMFTLGQLFLPHPQADLDSDKTIPLYFTPEI